MIPTTGTRLLLSYDFTKAFGGAFVSGGSEALAATVVINGTAGMPASYRGIHFNGDETGYISIANGISLLDDAIGLIGGILT